MKQNCQKRSSLILALVLIAVFIMGLSSPVMAQDTTDDDGLPAFSREQIEWVVEQYILNNPEIIERAMAVLEERRNIEAARVARDLLENNADTIFNDPMDPTVGNPEGHIQMVHFFDYQCGFCKSMAANLADTLTPDGRVRAQFKEFPILGPASVVAARAAMAADRQDMYWEMHQALMNNRGRLTENRVFAIAQTLGLDMNRLRQDMRDPEINEHLEKNRTLANQLGIQGTPGFVIGRDIYATSLSPENLRRALDHAERTQEALPADGDDDSRG